MRKQSGVVILVFGMASSALAQQPVVVSREESTVQAATAVLTEIMAAPASQIPESMLADAHGLVIVPGMVKGGFVVGVRHGTGVALVRDQQGAWQAPVFLTLTGGSIGWQAGLQSTDVILVFKTARGVQGLMSGKFTIGADAAVAAGPVGRQAAAGTDARLGAEVYSYGRSRGLFAGLALEGSSIQMQPAMSQAFYQAPGQPGVSQVPASAVQLVELVTRITNTPAAGALAAQPAAGSPAAVVTQTPVAAPARPAAVLNEATARQQLVASSQSLQSLLDENWKRFLALPSDLYAVGKVAAVPELQAALDRFDAVARNPQYASLTQRDEFKSTYDRLKVYTSMRAASSGTRLALPPPPSGQ